MIYGIQSYINEVLFVLLPKLMVYNRGDRGRDFATHRLVAKGPPGGRDCPAGLLSVVQAGPEAAPARGTRHPGHVLGARPPRARGLHETVSRSL